MRHARALSLVVVALGGTAGAALTIVGCSGDDNVVKDGGPDSADVMVDSPPPPDSGGKDAGPDAMDSGSDTGDPLSVFAKQLATAYCTRFATCCNGVDAGPFDSNACQQYVRGSGWNSSLTGIIPNDQLLSPEMIARNNVQVDQMSATACLAALATLSCPTVASSEYNDVTDKCYAATKGTLAAGAACIATIECQNTEFCRFEGIDGGKTDAGTTLGQCATLQGLDASCGAAPYGDPNFTSAECAYKGWHTPPRFCDYDNYPNGGYTCQPLRSNGDQCYFDQECTSGLCGTIGQDCVGTTCTCLTSRDEKPVCDAFKIQDAGPG